MFENHGHINFDTDKAYYFRHRTLHEKLIDLCSEELPKLQHMFAAILFYDSVTLKMGSKDPTFVTITSKNFISLNEILKTIIVNGFSGPSPNANDPLFIHFRINGSM